MLVILKGVTNMDRLTLKATIIHKIGVDNWGKTCNQIQEIAEKSLPKKSWIKYLEDTNRDMEICEGSDFVVFNGDYYDWKEFDIEKLKIVSSFLNYFSDTDLLLIRDNL